MPQPLSVTQVPSIPIILGVTGHRDVLTNDTQKIKEAVRAELRHVAALCPETQLVLMSALAEGADRLAAHVALEMNLDL